MVLPSDTTKPDIRIHSILADIEKLQLEPITNKTFVDTVVYLDGRDFIDCIFRNCRLFVKLGCFTIRGRRLHLEGCEFITDPPAKNIMTISNLLATQQPK